MNIKYEEFQKDEKVKKSLKLDRFRFLLILMALSSLVMFSAGCGGGSKEESKGSDSKTYDVSLKDSGTVMSVEPSVIEVESGENVILNVTNDGSVPHNLTMADGMGTADLQPFSSATLEIGKISEDTEVHCSIAGHKEQGMTLQIKVKS